MLDASIERQIDELSRRFGTPLRQTAVLENEGLFDPLGKTDRYGEVCMVVRRADGTLLTARKTFYPPEAYRLLTGGINHGEPIFDALLRETSEETGLDVTVRRFLAVLDYDLPRADRAPAAGSFTTFAFLLDEIGGTLACLDPEEQHDSFRDVPIDELPQIAGRLANLGQYYDQEIHGRWRDWGRFRAAAHRAVYQALTGDAL